MSNLPVRSLALTAILSVVSAPAYAASLDEGTTPEADVPAQETSAAPTSEAVEVAEPQAEAPAPNGRDPYRKEFGALPALGYSNAYGLGMGIVWTMAKFDPSKNPFDWKLSGLIKVNMKTIPGSGVTIPSQSHMLAVDMPGLAGGWLRLKTDIAYDVMLDSPYYGFGNDTDVTDWTQGVDSDDDAYDTLRQYNHVGITEPKHSLTARMTVSDASTSEHKKRLEVVAGYSLQYKLLDIYDGSKLADDSAADLDMLHGTENHLLVLLKTGMIWDTRDHEFTPTRGTFTQGIFDWSPGVQQGLSFGHLQAETSWFQALGSPNLVLAARLRVDAFTGTVPFYGPTQLGALSSQHVRGLRFGRYRGDLEVLENLELRSKLIDFNIGSQRFNIGLTGFFDAGRVWGESSEDLGPPADATADGNDPLDADTLHMGVGAGPRLQWGETFLIRSDYAVSPTDGTRGFYLTIGHRF